MEQMKMFPKVAKNKKTPNTLPRISEEKMVSRESNHPSPDRNVGSPSINTTTTKTSLFSRKDISLPENWWQSRIIQLDMGHDREISNQLEQLMGSSVVNITDRKYMLELQQRIIEMHYQNTEKRMANRMNEEVEREKRLMLENKMPMDENSPEISNHPVFTVQRRFERNPRVAMLRGNRKKQIRCVDDVEGEIRKQEEQEKRIDMVSRGDLQKKRSKARWDSTPEKDKPEIAQGEETGSESNSFTPETFCSASKRVLVDLSEFSDRKHGQPAEMKSRSKKSYEGPEEELRSPSDESEYINDLDWGTDFEGDDSGSLRALQISDEERYIREDEEENEFMLPESKLEALKYESPLIKELKRAKTVDELYTLADQIVGPVPDLHAK